MNIGRSKTILVMNQVETPVALLTEIIIHKHEDKSPNRLRIRGNVFYDLKALNHIQDVIIPLIDQISQK